MSPPKIIKFLTQPFHKQAANLPPPAQWPPLPQLPEAPLQLKTAPAGERQPGEGDVEVSVASSGAQRSLPADESARHRRRKRRRHSPPRV